MDPNLLLSHVRISSWILAGLFLIYSLTAAVAHGHSHKPEEKLVWFRKETQHPILCTDGHNVSSLRASEHMTDVKNTTHTPQDI